MIDIEVKNLTKTFLQPDSKNKHKYKYLNVLNNLNLEIKNKKLKKKTNNLGGQNPPKILL